MSEQTPVADLPQAISLTREDDQPPQPDHGEVSPDDLGAGADDEARTFTADYVKALRDEAAAHRIKAKRLDEANRRAVASIAELDGRLINPDEIRLTESMLDADGIVDTRAVRAEIDSLLAAKPYLQRRTPSSPIPQGVRQDVAQPVSLFQLVRERM